jgi:integrase
MWSSTRPLVGTTGAGFFEHRRLTPGSPALHFHDLRAEAACRLYEATGDAHRVMHSIGHRSPDETQKYIDRLIEDDLGSSHYTSPVQETSEPT